MVADSHKILVLSRNYPNSATPILGLWVEGFVNHVSKICELKVIAPTPYCPPIPGLSEFTKFRSVVRKQNVNGVDIFHPRLITGPGYSTYNFEGSLYYWSIRREVDRLREEFPFDLIHANFGYPDGVVAANLAARYNVPFIITEHASWLPWMNNYPQARRRAVWAASRCSFHIAVSNFARRTIVHFTGESKKLKVVPNGVDVSIFKPLRSGEQPNPNQILYVGFMRHVKGIDVLLQAMSRVTNQNPDLKLVLVGGGVYRHSKSQEIELHEMAVKLGLEKNVEFVGIKTPSEVAQYMRESALLVLPSRTETFGAVLIEALACGTPVVATRCGGTEDIVHERVGKLVPSEDPEALAEAIVEIATQRQNFDPEVLRDYALNNFAWEQIARQTMDLYSDAINTNEIKSKGNG